MPLAQGSSKAVISSNIKELISAGHDPKQAAAIAYKEAGEDNLETAREEDINGFIEIKGNPISKVGVFMYSGRVVGNGFAPDEMIPVYRPEEELNNPEAIESFKLLPLIIDHEMLGAKKGMTDPERKGLHGVTGEEIYYEAPYLKSNIKIFTENMENTIDNGKKDVSMGYRCLYEIKSGVYNGVPYKAIQRNLRGNHGAIVQQGRSGPDVSVLDSITFDSVELQMPEIKKEDVTKDNMESMVKDMAEKYVKDAFEKYTKDAEEAKAKEAKDAEEAEKMKKALGEDKKGMDESEVKKFIATEVALATDAAQISLRKETVAKETLANQLAPFIGVFDHAEMTLDSMGAYAAKELKLDVVKGQEVATVKGYLAGARKSIPVTILGSQQAMDSAESCSQIDSFGSN